MNDTFAKAVEAARDAILAGGVLDDVEAEGLAEAALRAALPLMAEALIGVAREAVQGERELRELAKRDGDQEGAQYHNGGTLTAADIAASQRAKLTEMMGEG